MSSSATRRERAAKEKVERKLKREEIIVALEYPPEALAFHGPIITTDITITQAHQDALTAAGEAIPPPVSCRFLIDTGADLCVVKHDIATRAGLKLINANAPIHGVGVDTSGKVYMGRVGFGVRSRVVAEAHHQMMIDTQVMSGDLKTDLFDGLIGRDVLKYFTLTYDGKSGRVTMRYHRPAP